jgi:uncharacterized protein YjbJ (UPF0337 family)
VLPPGAWGRRSPAKPANGNEVTTGSDAARPTLTINLNPENLATKEKAKPANAIGATTGFGVQSTGSDVENPKRIPSASAGEPFREAGIATAILQDLVVENGLDGGLSDGQAGIGTACLPTIQIGLCSDPIIGLPYAACAKQTIHEGGRKTRVGFYSHVALTVPSTR